MAEPVDEWVEDAPADEWVDDAVAEPPQIAQPGNPVDYGNYTEPGQLPQRQPTAWEQFSAAQQAPQPNQSVSQSGNEGLSVAQRVTKNIDEAGDDFSLVAGAKALYGMVQPPLDELKKTYINPVLTQAQGAIRESGFAKPLTDPALLLGGEPAETLAQNLLSLAIGPPEQYQTTAEQERRAVGVADSKLAQTAGGLALTPFFSNVSDTEGAAFAYGATKELAYLPLYAIDARKGAGALERATVAGGVFEALSPRPDADIARGIAFAGALGAGFTAGGELLGAAKKAVNAGQWIARQNLAGELVQRAAKASDLAVTPISEVQKIADAISTAPPKAGGKASMYILKPGDDGILVAEKITLTKDGQKFSTVVPLEQSPLQKRFNLAISEVGNKAEAAADTSLKTSPGRRGRAPVLVEEFDFDKVPPELRQQVTVFRNSDTVLPDVGTPDAMARGPAEITPRTDPTAPPQRFDIDTEHLPLNRLPDDDVLLSRTVGDVREFEVLTKREMQLLSLKNRTSEVRGLKTPEGTKWVELNPAQGDVKSKYEDMEGMKETIGRGQLYVQPLDPAERIGDSIETGLVVKASDLFKPTDGDLNRLLDARDALLLAEREAAQEAALVARESQAAADMAAVGGDEFVVQTPTGPKIAVTATQGQPPPQTPPPQLPTPNTPVPPTPVMANGNGGVVPPGVPPGPASAAPPPPTGNFVQRGLNALQQAGWAVMDKFINAAARGRRGPLTDDPRNMLRAAEAAGAFQAASAFDSILPRMLDIAKKRIAPWVDALPAASKAQFQRDVLAVLQSKNALVSDLKLKWPQLTAGIENAVTDFKYRTQKLGDELKAAGWIQPRDFTAPEGMRQVVDDILDDEAYVARAYLAPLAGKGEMKKLLAQDKALYDDILNEIARDIVKKSKPSGTNPSSVLDEARIELETWLGNPDNIIAEPPGSSSGGSRQGAAALKEKRAAKLEAMGLTYQQWRQNNVSAIKPSMRFVKGATNEAQFFAELKRGGLTLPRNDIEFLKEMRAEVGERLKPWQEKALRQIQDPFTLAAFSVARQEALHIQMQAVDTAIEAGMMRSQLQLQAFGIDPVLDGWKQVPKDRAIFGPHAEKSGPEQMWVHPEAWEHLNNVPEMVRSMNMLIADAMQADSLLVRGLAKGHFHSKAMLTIGAPSPWVSNIFGGMWGVVKAGVSPLDLFANNGFTAAVRQWSEFAVRPNQVTIRGQKITGADWMREGMKYGTVGTDSFSEEMQPGMKQLLKADVLGSVTKPHHLAVAWRKAQQLGVGIKEWYMAIDSVFRHGTWLSLLKKGGLNLDTGKLLDRKKAEALINGSRFRQAMPGALNSPTQMDLSVMSDEQVADVLKSAMAWRTRRSFAVPGQPGQATRAVAAANNLTLGMSGNLFARTAMEEIRSDMMLPYRAATDPGVAGALIGWGAVAGGITLGLQHSARSSGVTEEDEKQSIQGLPTSARSYSPVLQAARRYDGDGRAVVVDMAKLWQPMRYTGGDVMGRSIPDQMGIAPGQLAARTFYNITAGAVFGGSPVGEGVDAMARGAGLNLPEAYNAPVLDEGAQSLAKRAAAYVLPGVVTQVARAQSRAADPANAGVGEYMRPLTGGLFRVGGTPQQAGKNSRNEAKYIEAERDRQQALRSAARKTSDEDEAARLREERNRLKQQRGTTKRYQSENP